MNMEGCEFACAMCSRYTSARMKELFCERNKISTWRVLWTILAESQKELGLEQISDKIVEEMRKNIRNIDLEKANEFEKKFQHDVVANIHAFADVVPKGKGIIHLGATSEYVKDNADMLLFRKAFRLILGSLRDVVIELKELMLKWRDTPTLGFTHLQPAQLTTVGKRFSLYCQSFLFDYAEVISCLKIMKLRGIKGATGTQASFLELFGGDFEKVRELESLFSAKLGISLQRISGQTYDRKIDARMCSVLAGISTSIHKMCNDIRILAGRREVEESFGKFQVGSSAMPYKQNPMKCERATALARYVIQTQTNSYQTAAEQWFERTLDDSANRRISVIGSIILTDYILNLTLTILKGIRIYPKIIERHIAEELPFIATEKVLVECTKVGIDRQIAHERLRLLWFKSAKKMKENGDLNPMMELLRKDDFFSGVQLDDALDPMHYIGMAREQVDHFIKEDIDEYFHENPLPKEDIDLTY